MVPAPERTIGSFPSNGFDNILWSMPVDRSSFLGLRHGVGGDATRARIDAERPGEGRHDGKIEVRDGARPRMGL